MQFDPHLQLNQMVVICVLNFVCATLCTLYMN
uniref:Uncharacterized protein n=1 Tax=Arundo donax TaxID=35708 RepID=A0A0A9FHY6_ARUDO